jgi:hypothetical protein
LAATATTWWGVDIDPTRLDSFKVISNAERRQAQTLGC